MSTRELPISAALLAVLLMVPVACGDDGAGQGEGAEGSETGAGDGDGDGDGATTGDGTTTGDGDGDGDADGTTTGDGDGDLTTGDGDGDGDGDLTTGDGDGDATTTGDGDGDATGDGDGDATTTGDGDGDATTTGDGDGDATTTGDGDGDPLTFDNCGFPEDGPWVEIEYWQLGSVSSPSWEFSNTPGWGEPQWAWGNESWPEIYEFGGNSMSNDPIGIVAEISGTWQIMIGLQDLIAYDHATVCIEGRSVSVSSQAIMDVYNPLNNCGVGDVAISHSWEVHKVGVDLGDCLVTGAATQAVRIDPWGGSGRVGLKRVRVTLHGAVY